MKQMKYIMTIGALVAFFTGIASAELVNGDFASGSANWTSSGDTGNQEFIVTHPDTLHPVFDGTNGGDGYHWFTALGSAGISQDITINAGSGGDYVLSGDFVQRSDGYTASHVDAVFTMKLFVQGGSEVTVDSTAGAFPSTGYLNMPAHHVAQTYNGLAAGDYTVEFTISGGQGALDNASLVPEPATLGMVAVFGGALLFIRRKLMI